ncbi:hypothetical protein NP493_27g03000 [Ridgeia piscesae]|uniref:Long-chain-fatty-acid--CoA ligase n=1 Tax=Ridgeia piscesae TaxID=27915 RepID=A0AAD9UK93_RIDPI|nr:hypothetical protein NP493_27g03000 [Ridgeia piscesae]
MCTVQISSNVWVFSVDRDPDMAEWWRSSMSSMLSIGAATITAGAALYMATRPQQFDTPLDLNNQSQEVPGMPSARTSWYCKNGQLVEYLHEDLRTFYDGFKRGARLSDNGNCLGWKPSKTEPYKWLSYNHVLEAAEFLGSGIIYKGIHATNTSRIGIYSKNTPQYVITDLACATYSMVLVPLYDTLGPDTCTFIINQASINLVVCDTTERVIKLLEHRSETPELRIVVCVEPLTSELTQLAEEVNVDVITFDDLNELGQEHHHMPKPCIASDLCMVCYTSGTTGGPKGAMITHRNLIGAVAGIALHLGSIEFSSDDVYLSYLPLAHVYEKVNQAFLYSQGCQVGFYQGDMRALKDDLVELKPTIFTTVPRLLNRVYDKVISVASKTFFRNYMFQMGYNSKLREVERGIIRKNSIWDTLIFRKVQNSLGGRVRVVISGSAPLSPRVLNFTRVALGCIVIEGYGQTEGTAVISAQVPGDSGTGYVGPPWPTNIVRIVDVPEMDYYAKNQKGEVCVKGANVFVGYLNEPEKTAEALDSDGWLHTGDIGMWLPNGALKIIDRKKNIFKLAQGEYISPEKIENIYIRSEVVGQIMVHGDSLKASLVGIVVPDPDEFCRWVKTKLDIHGTMAELCAMPEVKKAILEDILAVGKKAGLMSFEQVRDIYIPSEQFTVENGLLTPTHKSKRHNIQNYYAKQIEEMYLHLQ